MHHSHQDAQGMEGPDNYGTDLATMFCMLKNQNKMWTMRTIIISSILRMFAMEAMETG